MSSDHLRLLVAHGANPNAAPRGEGMLHFAVASNCLDCVKALVESGADVNAIRVRCDPKRNPSIITAYPLAKHVHADIAAYLQRYRCSEVCADFSETGERRSNQRCICFAYTCASRHVTGVKDLPRRGPNLWSVVGRMKTSTPFGHCTKTPRVWPGPCTY
ncbi:ankyrin repeat domain-containing protein [Rhizobium sp. BK181]|uniref:ankyrin repeat domain-containing protein n=1 Tax=Rhizobium sp. BK181 TaxID=2587072 RepID=UPI0028B0CA26|nr:ankyrin repeat domain-containing protein [Rhizobium sp. BK181]